jgi:hypothetical protein
MLAAAFLAMCLFELCGGCYPGGIGKWKGIPDHSPGAAGACGSINNPCNNPWAYPPLHD